MANEILFAFRNLTRQRRRYLLLGGGIGFGFLIITMVTGLLGGMISNLQQKAIIYYGGDFTVIGSEKTGKNTMIRLPEIGAAVEKAFPGGRATASLRTVNRSSGNVLFFGGDSVRQRQLTGVDWAVEEPIFRKLNYVEGGAEGLAGTNGVLISEPIAKMLGARVGDDLMILADTINGQKNTTTVVVKGIFRDSSLFGYYTTYIDRKVLNAFIGYGPDEGTEAGIYFGETRPTERERSALYSSLKDSLPFFPMVKTIKEMRDVQDSGQWDGIKYVFLPLDAHLSQINQMVEAISALSFVLVFILLAILVLGIGNTFQVLVYERSREIGTMRALGMQRISVSRLFLSEAGGLAIAGSLVGLLVGMMLLWAFSKVNFSWIPGFDVFLRKGRLSWRLDSLEVVGELVLMIVASLFAAWSPAKRAAAIEPAQTLRTE
jgi:putative ABC transport system permease protein